jgi:hypothetical protein
VDQINQVIYPDGALIAPQLFSVVTLVDIRRGWPLPTTLDIALASGRDVLVRVYPEPGMTRNTSRFTLQYRDLPTVAPSLFVSVTGATVTFTGSGDASHIAGVMVGSPPHGVSFAYRLLLGDGPTEVAIGLQRLIGGSTSAIAGVLTLLTNLPVIARVVNDQQSFLEVRRQDQGFRVSIWSANNAARDAVAALIDSALAYLTDVNGNPTMNLVIPSDNSAAWLRYRSTYNMDGAEKAGLYRRDLCYLIEYPTTIVETFPEVLFAVEAVTVNSNPPPITLIS